MKGKIVFKGGSGSGNFGHTGRPGKVGGSGGSAYELLDTAPKELQTSVRIRVEDMNDRSSDGVVQAAIDEISLAEDWGYEREYHTKTELQKQARLANKAKKFLRVLHDNGVEVNSKYLAARYAMYKELPKGPGGSTEPGNVHDLTLFELLPHATQVTVVGNAAVLYDGTKTVAACWKEALYQDGLM